jgi:dUTP pyrophosphatase
MGVTVRLRRLSNAAKMPVSAHAGDAGFDLFAAEDAKIPPSCWAPVRTGIAIEIPEGFEGQIRSRSGLANDSGIIVMNSPGTIDAGYRGEIVVLLLNLGKEAFGVATGTRLAQLVISQCIRVNFVEGEQLSPSGRGKGGLGSTGR